MSHDAAPALKFSTTFAVSPRYSIDMTYQVGHGLRVEWAPDIPSPGQLSEAEMNAYRDGRDAFLKTVARVTGRRFAVVE